MMHLLYFHLVQKSRNDRVVKEKLDRAMANDRWFDRFSNAIVACLTTTLPDHYLFWLHCAPQVTTVRGHHHFCFGNAWLVELEFKLFDSQRWQGYGNCPL